MYGQDIADALFVGTVYIGVEQADGEGGDALVLQFLCEGDDLCFIDPVRHGAVGEGALGDAPGEVTRHDRVGIFDLRVEHVVAVLVANIQNVPKTFGD